MTRVEIPWKPTKEQLAAAAGLTVPDLIAPGLQVLFCGINPGLYTAAIGHHFGRPGNRFWKVLHLAGFTDRQLSPFEEHELLEGGYGITNMVARTTATAAELQADEMRAGRANLETKVRTYRPHTLAVLGVGAYRTAFAQPKATVGRQPDGVNPASLGWTPSSGELATELWVLPNPSGLQAHYQLPDMVELFRELRRWR